MGTIHGLDPQLPRACAEEATGTQPKSLIRMFGPRGNRHARNLFSVLGVLRLEVTPLLR